MESGVVDIEGTDVSFTSALLHAKAAVKDLEPTADAHDVDSAVHRIIDRLRDDLKSEPDSMNRQKLLLRGKLSLYSLWQSDMRRRISRSHTNVSAAMGEMDEVQRALFGFCDSETGDLSTSDDSDVKEVAHYQSQSSPHTTLLRHHQAAATWGSRAKEFFRLSAAQWLPPVGWIPNYPHLLGTEDELRPRPHMSRLRAVLTNLRSDLLAGLTTGVFMIPQSMAYGALAGISPLAGLYTGFVAPCVYAGLGTGRQASVGPVALVSLLTASAIAATPASTPEQKLGAAACLALFVGAFLFLMGLLRLGFITNFLSAPVLSGFTSAAAVLIAVSQVHTLFGVPSDASSTYAWQTMYHFFAHIAETNWPTILLGLIAITVLLIMRAISPVLPSALFVMIIAIAISWPLDLHYHANIAVVGEIKIGLPVIALPSFEHAKLLILNAALISVIGFAESVAVVKMWAARCGYKEDASQELIALGAANIMTAFVGGIPSAAGISRSAVNANAGAKSTLSTLFSALILMVTLLWLTWLVYHLPKCILAAIVVVAVSSLVDLHEPRKLWRTSKVDLVMLCIAFLATVAATVEIGLLIAVGCSLLLTIFKASRPNSCVLGRLPGTVVYRDVNQYPDALRIAGVVTFQFDGPIYFGNAAYLEEQLMKMLDVVLREQRSRSLVCDFNSVSSIDATGTQTLREVFKKAAQEDVLVIIAGLDGAALSAFRVNGLDTMLGLDHFVLRTHDGVLAALSGKLQVIPVLLPPKAVGVLRKCVRRCKSSAQQRGLCVRCCDDDEPEHLQLLRNEPTV